MVFQIVTLIDFHPSVRGKSILDQDNAKEKCYNRWYGRKSATLGLIII